MKANSEKTGKESQTKLSKREIKKAIGVPLNSKFFLPIGLILSLLFVVVVLEAKIGTPIGDVYATNSINLEEYPVVVYAVDKEMPKTKTAKRAEPVKREPVKKVKIIKEIKIVPNKVEYPETKISSSEPEVAKRSNPVSGNVASPKSESPKNILSVEHAPVFPGCDASASNAEKVDCMSSKINAFILRKFDSDKFNYLEGLQRITVQFKINSNGEITDVKAIAKDKDLANEAKRVIEKLPIMRPGRMGDTNVDVLYSIPILFQIQ